jgi:phage-related protein
MRLLQVSQNWHWRAGREKTIEWIGSSRKDVKSFPEDVRWEIGFALDLAERGEKAINVVPLVGYGGAKVLEIISNHDGNTFRAVYTIRFAEAVYVLHAFQKKSKRGAETPRPDKRLINARLKVAEEHYRNRAGQKERTNDRRA